MKTPFVPSRPPFADFCVLVHPGEPAAKEPPLVSRAVASMLGEARRWSFGGTEVALHATGPTLALERTGCVSFEGFGNEGAEPLGPPGRARELVTSLGGEAPFSTALRGHFTAIVAGREQMTIFTDWLGYSHLYVADLPGQVLITNRLHLAAKVLETTGLLRCRPEGMVQCLTLDTTFGHETLVERVRLVPLHRFLEIDADGLHERSRFDVVRFLDHTHPRDYSELLHQAAVEIRENWVAACNDDPTRRRILYLTGGVDSRVALAGAVSAQVDSLRYHTRGAPSDPDKVIAAKLAQSTGLEWTRDPRPAALDARTAVDAWTSYHFGQRNISFIPIELDQRDRIRFTGGSGENARGFYTTRFRKRLGDAIEHLSLAELAGEMAQQLGRWQLVVPGARTAMREHYLRVLEEQPLTAATSASIDGLYPLFRNRFHFGFGMRVASMACTQLTPLASPSALLASLRCGFMARLSGKVARDLIHVLAPRLLDEPFESGPLGAWAFHPDPPLRDAPPPPHPLPTPSPCALDPQRRDLDRGPPGIAPKAHAEQLLALLRELGPAIDDVAAQHRAYLRPRALRKQMREAVEQRDMQRVRALVVRCRLLLEFSS